jgi:hypothetical protein
MKAFVGLGYALRLELEAAVYVWALWRLFL